MTYSEEVAFNDPPAGGAERLILNQHLRRLLTHSKLSAFQRFVQGVRSHNPGFVTTVTFLSLLVSDLDEDLPYAVCIHRKKG